MQIARYTIMALVSVILCGVAFLLGLPHIAQATPLRLGSACTTGGKEIVIYYINGVMTDHAQAVANMEQFRDFFVLNLPRTLPPSYSEDKVCFIIDNLENSKVGVLGDLLESAHQLDQLDPKEFWLTLGDVYTSLAPLGGAKLKLLKRLAVANTDSSVIDTAAIQAHAAKIAEDIRDHCRSVILLPHSQGNLYAHMAIDLVSDNPSVPAVLFQALRVIGVATPDVDQPSFYRGIYSWRSNHGDILMGDNVPLLFPLTGSNDGLVRQLNPDLYGANTEWTTGPIDWLFNHLGHGFAGYLKFQPSQDNIRATIVEALNDLSVGGCIHFSDSHYSAPFNVTSAIIKIQRTGTSFNDEDVKFDTRNGTPQAGVDPAQEGIDYEAQHKTLTIHAGQTELSVEIRLMNNSSGRPKTVDLILSNPISNPINSRIQLTTPTTATLTIQSVGLTNCPDPAPIITAYAWAYEGYAYVYEPSHREDWAQPGPVQIGADSGLARASATGNKGSVSVNAFSSGHPEIAAAHAQLEYTETFIVTSPGKTGDGIAIVSVSASAGVTANCVVSATSYHAANAVTNVGPESDYLFPPLQSKTTAICSGAEGGPTIVNEPSGDTPNIPITYGTPAAFHVGVVVRAASLASGASVSGAASVTYSVTVLDDPNATVTFCRAVP